MRYARTTSDHPKGVWTLPPTLRLGDTDRDKYLAIGESDRMTLKFVKPAQVGRLLDNAEQRVNRPAPGRDCLGRRERHMNERLWRGAVS